MCPDDQTPVPPEIVVREVSCAKETLELGEGVVKFLKALKVAGADGWSVGEDLPPVLASLMGDLLPAMDGVTKIGAEYSGSKQAFINGIMVPVGGFVGELIDG